MSESSRRSSGRRNRVGQRPISSLETLERRDLMAANAGAALAALYVPQGVLAPAGFNPSQGSAAINRPIGNGARQLSFLDNDGKILTGKDRQGDEWQITVHGPGAVIVTDATPNDGVLDDSIDTIQIVGSNPHTTVVTGQVTSSARVQTPDVGTVLFNRLISVNGVKSIVLNGFTLAQTVPPAAGQPNNAGIEVYLPGGVGLLSFENILAPIDEAFADQPIDIVIGQPNSPLSRAPIIKLASIFNTVFDSTLSQNPNGTPPIAPTVNITVNGQIKDLSFVSTTQTPIPAGSQFAFPVVGTTGRTAVRATAIGNLHVAGSARNFTAAKNAKPFGSSSSGLTSLGVASFGGVSDIVGLDVSGKVKGLKFARGLGDPIGALPGATHFGTPDAERGASSFGLQAGLVRGTSIGHVVAAPANMVLQTTQDPDFIQSKRTGSTTFFARPGNAFTNSVIASAGSIGKVSVVGNLQSSEIKAGFDYSSFLAGLEGTRAKSRIGKLNLRGDLVDSVISSTYRPTNNIYGDINSQGQTDDVAGPGVIKGNQRGSSTSIGSATPLNNTGQGNFARRKLGHLPPPETPKRFQGVLVG
jgi:hypothetical protein